MRTYLLLFDHKHGTSKAVVKSSLPITQEMASKFWARMDGHDPELLGDSEYLEVHDITDEVMDEKAFFDYIK